MLRRLMRMLAAETLQGYQHPEVIETVFQKTAAYAPQQGLPDVAGASAVLDFGGGCGRHYKEARLTVPDVRWAVVETPAMAGRAKDIETDNLRFFTSIRSAADWLGIIDVMHSNGAIQFAEDQQATIAQLCRLRARKMLWYRINFSETTETVTQISRLADHGPNKMRGVRNANVATDFRLLRESDFLAAHSEYRLEARGPDWIHFSLI